MRDEGLGIRDEKQNLFSFHYIINKLIKIKNEKND